MAALIALVIFIGVPIAEIIILIEVGGVIGTWPTIGLVILTAVLGSALIRWQGRGVLNEARRGLEEGTPPVGAVVDGVFLLLAGALLLTPGFVTDALGFSFLVPAWRRAVAGVIWRWLQQHGQVHVHGMDAHRPGRANRRPKPDVVDAEFVDVTPPPDGKPNPDSPWRSGN